MTMLTSLLTQVRGGFTVPRVSSAVTISSTRSPIVKNAASDKPLLSEITGEAAKAAEQPLRVETPKKRRGPSNGVIFSNDNQEVMEPTPFVPCEKCARPTASVCDSHSSRLVDWP